MEPNHDFDNERLNIPEWHIEVIKARLLDYMRNPDIALEFDEAMDQTEAEL